MSAKIDAIRTRVGLNDNESDTSGSTGDILVVIPQSVYASLSDKTDWNSADLSLWIGSDADIKTHFGISNASDAPAIWVKRFDSFNSTKESEFTALSSQCICIW